MSKFTIYHAIMMIITMVSVAWLALWSIYHFFNALLPYSSYLLITIIYCVMMLFCAHAYDTNNIYQLHQHIGIKSTNFIFIILAIVIALIIWLVDHYWQLSVLHTDIFQQAQQWHNNQPHLLSAFMGSVLLIPVIEEMLFRGVLFNSVKRHLPPLSSALILSIIFTLIHFDESQILSLFIASMVYYLLTHQSQSIVPAIIAHIINNGLTFINFYALVN